MLEEKKKKKKQKEGADSDVLGAHRDVFSYP